MDRLQADLLAVPTFVTFAGDGLWSDPQSVSSSNLAGTPGLEIAINTYATSATLSTQKFSATYMSTSDLAEFQSNCKTTGTNMCKNNKGQAIYWSPITQRQYQFNWSGKDATFDPYTVLSDLAAQKYYADFPVLFDGAYNCTLEGKAGGSVMSFNADGTLDLSCMSVLPVYFSKKSSCPTDTVQVNGKCPFGFN